MRITMLVIMLCCILILPYTLSGSEKIWTVTQVSRDSQNLLPVWSHNGKSLAYVSTDEKEGVHISILDVQNPEQKKTFNIITSLSDIQPAGLVWLWQSNSLILTLAEVSKQGKCTGLIFYLIETDKPKRAREIKRISFKETGIKIHWIPKHFTYLPDKKGMAVCLSIWPSNQTADEHHQGKIITVKSDKTVSVTDRTYRWIENTPGGNLMGVRYDGIWILNEQGKEEKKLAAFQGKQMVQAVRCDAERKRIAWSVLNWKTRSFKWFIQEKSRTEPFMLPSSNKACVKDLWFLSPDTIIASSYEIRQKKTAVITGGSGQKTRKVEKMASYNHYLPLKNIDLSLKKEKDLKIPELPEGGVEIIHLSAAGTAGCIVIKDQAYLFQIQKDVPGPAQNIGRTDITSLAWAAASGKLNEIKDRYIYTPVVWAPKGPACAAVSPVLQTEKNIVLDESLPQGEILLFTANCK